MLKLRDLEVGMWVSDTTGIYEITDINERVDAVYTLKEVIDDEPTGAERFLTSYEMKRMERM